MTMQTISELLRHEKESSGLSYRDLVARASNAGYSLKFQTLNELVTSGPKSWPKHPDTFRAIAAILRTNEKAVVLAYAASLGLNVEDPTSALANRLPAGTDKLSPSMQDALIAVVRAATQEATSHEESHPESHPESQASNVHQLRPVGEDVVSREKSSEDLAAYDTGPHESMYQTQTRQQDEEAEQSQDPDDHEGI